MTKGVLIFAQNTELNYVELAELAALRVKKYLKVPVSIVTNKEYKNAKAIFDKVIVIKNKKTQYRIVHDGEIKHQIKWLNFDRHKCYDISPYDRTLVIDADYLICSPHLLQCFSSNKDFLIFNKDYYLNNNILADEFEYINEFGVPFYWATVFYFTKTEKNRLFFKFIDFIKENWEYYSLLYNINDQKFRNDFAFSIALNLFTNHNQDDSFGFIPGKLFYTIDKDKLIDMNHRNLTFMLQDNIFVKTERMDVHVMNKHSIIQVCNE